MEQKRAANLQSPLGAFETLLRESQYLSKASLGARDDVEKVLGMCNTCSSQASRTRDEWSKYLEPKGDKYCCRRVLACWLPVHFVSGCIRWQSWDHLEADERLSICFSWTPAFACRVGAIWIMRSLEYIYTCIYICTYIYICKHIHTNACICTYTQKLVSPPPVPHLPSHLFAVRCCPKTFPSLCCQVLFQENQKKNTRKKKI